jgi:hypothetical protein
MKFVSRMVVLCVFLAAASVVLGQKQEPYSTVEIERFTVAQGVEFPDEDLSELMGQMTRNFTRSRRFEYVFLSTDSVLKPANARRVKISGTVIKYTKGNRAARYLVGLGAGRTKLVASVKVVDAESGQLLFEQNVDGHVYGGFFGGETDAAKGGVASEIIKTMTKKGYARKDRLKS